MAKASKDKKDDAELDDAEASDEEREEAESSEEEEAEAEDRPSDEPEEDAEPPAKKEKESDAEAEEEEEEEEESAAQLGIQRYVLAAFFTAGLVGAYVLGKFIHGVWAWMSNKYWFQSALPSLAAFDDDRKTTVGTVLGAIIAIVLVVRTYRKPSVREWADEVATELAKVKWPTRKEVSNSTMVVIAAGAFATLYLALLDWIWALISDRLYGS